MANYDTVPVTSQRPIQLVTQGDGIVLLQNSDQNNTVYIGENEGIIATNPNGVVPLPPLASVVVDGSTDVWAVSAIGETIVVLVIPGGLNFFQLLEILVKTIIVSASKSNGIFVYNPSPGTGDLILAIAGAAGTDQHGNSYGQGLEIINGNKSILLNQAGAAGGVPSIQFFSGAAEETGEAAIFEQVINPGASEFIDFEIFGAFNASSSHVGITMRSAAKDVSILGTMLFVYVDTAGNQHDYMAMQANGIACSMQQMNSVQPGTNDTTTVNETWHPLPLVGNFAAGTIAPEYQFEAVNGGRVRLRGNVELTANSAANAQFAAMPAGYVPSFEQILPMTPNNLAGLSFNAAMVIAETSGALVLGSTGNNGQSFWLDGLTYVLF